MRFAIAGGGFAGLAAALALARAGHEAVVAERDPIGPSDDPAGAFDVERRGIPHFRQPHAFLPRGRKVLAALAPDVLAALTAAGAEEQDLGARLHGPREPGDEDLVWLWARRPLIEWALRAAATAEPGVTLLAGRRVEALLTDDAGRACGLRLDGGERVEADVVVDALGRTRTPPGWPRATARSSDCGAVYYSRYFAWHDGASMPDGPWLLAPRGELGYLAFNTFRGDNGTFAVTFLAPAGDRALRILREEAAFTAACAQIPLLARITDPAVARPITPVLPMGGLVNSLRADEPVVGRFVPAGDALCHTNPSYAYGLSFALVHADALATAAGDARDPDAVVAAYRAAVLDEAAERHALACETDAARARAMAGERLDVAHADGCFPLFAYAAAGAAALRDDEVLRRTVGRLGLLEAVATFDGDRALHERIEAIFGAMVAASPPSPAGPPREDLLAAMSGDHSKNVSSARIT